MINQQTLKRDVLQCLRKNYSIKLQIPTFKKHITDKINLRIFKSPLGENLPDNRYRLLISSSEELLKKNIINTQKIKEFGEHFFETISQDIQVLQSNEEIRRNFTRIRDQITYRIQQLGVEQRTIEEQCREINDKEDILVFLQGSFKSYLSNVKVVSEHYEAVNNVQVFTSINIDNLYSQRLAQEEDYVQHYQPLLQVMQRLKANMIKLYQELSRCEYFQLPLKSANFLANCKNLLTQLQPFLIKPDCVFNRLIFLVTKGQKQNNRLISKAFQSNIAFTNDIVADIFKSFFLGHIFKDYYLAIGSRIQTQRQQLVSYFQNKHTNLDNFQGYIHKVEKAMGEIKQQINSLQKIIGSGKDKIMRQYLGRKECKKSHLLMNLFNLSNKIVTFARSMQQFLKFKNKIQWLKEKETEAERHVGYTLGSLKQLEQNNINIQKPANSNIKQIEQQIDKKIKDSYLLIQQGLIGIEQIKIFLKQAREQQNDDYFERQFFPSQQMILQNLVEEYSTLENELLNNYLNLKKKKIQRREQTKQTKQKIFQQLNDYFQNHITGEMGFQIRNEDEECEIVKDNIIKIEQMQFMINNYLNTKNNDELQQLHKLKINLQWLLQVFEGSMDQKIFQNFLQKLNFQIQDWKQKSKRVKQLTKELARYIGILKGILKGNSSGRVFPKVFKLIKSRIQVYQIIQDMFQQFLLIYETCKQSNHLNISDYGLKIFDEPTYKYVLMLYQYKNRMRAEMQEIKDLLLPRKTINYLLDELYEPFQQIFSNFVNFTEDELLNFTRRLQDALNFKLSHLQIIRMFEQALSKPYSIGYFSTILRLSEQLKQLNSRNKKVLELEDEEVLIHNLKDFKISTQTIKEHIVLAQQIISDLKNKNVTLEVELKNNKLQILQEKIVKDWQQNKDQAVKSLSFSRVEEYSQHNEP